MQQRAEFADREAERASKERIAMLQLQTERLRLASTLAIHSNEQEAAQKALHMEIASNELRQVRDHAHAMTQAERQREHDAEMEDSRSAKMAKAKHEDAMQDVALIMSLHMGDQRVDPTGRAGALLGEPQGSVPLERTMQKPQAYKPGKWRD
jgi:hypothetical protein